MQPLTFESQQLVVMNDGIGEPAAYRGDRHVWAGVDRKLRMVASVGISGMTY